jgi:hypothetical protein
VPAYRQSDVSTAGDTIVRDFKIGSEFNQDIAYAACITVDSLTGTGFANALRTGFSP